MNKLKLVTVVGTRPEIIKLSETIKNCDLQFQHTLVHTGQNYDYELNGIFFKDLKVRKPDFFLNINQGNLGQNVGDVIAKTYDLFLELKPNALLILGDTNSGLCSISAKRLKIPVFHLEAGNRCFDENLPEEINRRIIDHISDVNMAYTEHARRYLFSEGLNKDRIFVTGSPMREILTIHEEKIKNSQILKTLDLRENDYFLLSTHREENVDNADNLMSIINAINEIAEKYNKLIIFSMHPRTKKRMNNLNIQLNENILIQKPFGFFDYMKLQINALCVISDSGTLAEESSILDFNAVSLRTSTERPEAMDSGNLILSHLDSTSIKQSMELSIISNIKGVNNEGTKDYSTSIFSQKVVKIIQSYTYYVLKNVWGNN